MFHFRGLRFPIQRALSVKTRVQRFAFTEIQGCSCRKHSFMSRSIKLNEFQCQSTDKNSVTSHALQTLNLSECSSVTQSSSPRVENRRYFADGKPTKELTIWSNLKEVRSSPMPALVLGFSGLLPFLAAPCFMIMSQAYMASIAFAQVTYGATILSFLGGVRWGFTISEDSVVAPDWYNLGYSVTPPLVAWIGLLLPSPFSLLTMIGGIAGAAYFDTSTWGYPPWFKGMRFALSFVAILGLWTTYVCSFLLEKSGTDGKKDDENTDTFT